MSEPHRKTIKHQHELGDFHELTFSCYRRLPLLTNDHWRHLLSQSLQSACEEESMDLVAFVYMPEHVHLLVFPRRPKPDIGRFLAKIKQPFSSRIRELLQASCSPLLKKLTLRERPEKIVFRFWQEGPGFDRNIFRPEVVQASMHYIHKNPVARQLCQRAIDWPWSSARYYLAEPPQQQFPKLPHIHGLPPEALDGGSTRG